MQNEIIETYLTNAGIKGHEAAKIREQLKIPLETFAEKVRPFFARDLADNNPNTGWKMTLRFIAPYL